MSRKVWVIEDTTQASVFEQPNVERTISSNQQERDLKKNPALAFSLSLFIWGAGQFYNRQWKVGILFLLQMINFYLYIYILIKYWGYLKTLFEPFSMTNSEILLICIILYISGLLLWYINVWQAYFISIKMNSKTFAGFRVKFLPTICSLLISGWGQCMNGQIKKSLLYLSFALLSFGAFPVTLIIFRVWPALESSHERIILEWIFAVCLIAIPFVVIIWFINIFDATKISMNELKKDRIQKRIRNLLKKIQQRSLLYGRAYFFIHQIKRISLFMLLLMFCMIISYHYFPHYFYTDMLHNFEMYLSQKDMTVIPGFIHRLIH